MSHPDFTRLPEFWTDDHPHRGLMRIAPVRALLRHFARKVVEDDRRMVAYQLRELLRQENGDIDLGERTEIGAAVRRVVRILTGNPPVSPP